MHTDLQRLKILKTFAVGHSSIRIFKEMIRHEPWPSKGATGADVAEGIEEKTPNP